MFPDYLSVSCDYDESDFSPSYNLVRYLILFALSELNMLLTAGLIKFEMSDLAQVT